MSDIELLAAIKTACCNGYMDYARECLEKSRYTAFTMKLET